MMQRIDSGAESFEILRSIANGRLIGRDQGAFSSTRPMFELS